MSIISNTRIGHFIQDLYGVDSIEGIFGRCDPLDDSFRDYLTKIRQRYEYKYTIPYSYRTLLNIEQCMRELKDFRIIYVIYNAEITIMTKDEDDLIFFKLKYNI